MSLYTQYGHFTYCACLKRIRIGINKIFSCAMLSENDKRKAIFFQYRGVVYRRVVCSLVDICSMWMFLNIRIGVKWKGLWCCHRSSQSAYLYSIWVLQKSVFPWRHWLFPNHFKTGVCCWGVTFQDGSISWSILQVMNLQYSVNTRVLCQQKMHQTINLWRKWI